MIRTVHLGQGHDLEIHELTGAMPGPVLAVLGGVHGDELEGIMAARMVLHRVRDGAPFAGTLRVVPVSNPPAHLARQRTSPIDDTNLARVFPGDPNGRLTQRIAHVITDQVISGADLLIDLHSSGVKYQMPVFAGYVIDPATSDAARAATYAFGAPVVWEHEGSSPGRSLSVAADLQIPSIYVEGSGGGGLIGADLDIYVDGVMRVMRWLSMTTTDFDPPPPPLRLLGGVGDTDASLSCSVDGLCVTRVRPTEVVSRGVLLADILDPGGQVVEQLHSPSDGTVMMLRRQADVHAGDGIAMLGPVPAAGPS